MSLDTLKASKHLQEAGFAQPQAEAIVKVIHDVRSELATKADINQLHPEIQADIKELHSDIKWLKWNAIGVQILLLVFCVYFFIDNYS